MTYLGDLDRGRDNNFNLIRAIAATAVLVSHAYPITQGPDVLQPMEKLTGLTLGTLSVYAFFAISGYLIAASFERSRTRLHFIAARVLRLVPGLLVSLLVVAYLIGPLVTTLPLAAYFSDPAAYSFLFRNLVLYTPQYTLPGVFETAPYTTIEGSIWTLFYEVAAYVILFFAGLTGALAKPRVMAVLLALLVALWVAVRLVDIELPTHLSLLIRMALPFATGSAFYIWRAQLPLSIVGVAALIGLSALTRNTVIYEAVLVLALSYIVFWAAYIPNTRWLRAYNRVGDYSYGIYIYAFPIQGLAVWMFGSMSPLQNMAIALPMTLLPSILSWHLIEKPALAVRYRLADALRPASRAAS